ncbi:hypothetical protein [Exiguobacterium chiriqhucha]|uniref:hypothetical protein n=1 Tax=Exiguobacterium chiriqhucha TaxID=1385984 RepID=UPI00130E2B1A|nr:hypothetical protein [Exiguobacterium chiriqhucha]
MMTWKKDGAGLGPILQSLLSIQIQMADKQAERDRHDDGRNQADEQQGTHAFSPF